VFWCIERLDCLSISLQVSCAIRVCRHHALMDMPANRISMANISALINLVS